MQQPALIATVRPVKGCRFIEDCPCQECELCVIPRYRLPVRMYGTVLITHDRSYNAYA